MNETAAVSLSRRRIELILMSDANEVGTGAEADEEEEEQYHHLVVPVPPAPPQTMELLAELNNEGASHLENGLLDEAIATFTSALSVAMQQEDNEDDNEIIPDSTNSTSGGQATAAASSSSVASQLRAVAADIRLVTTTNTIGGVATRTTPEEEEISLVPAVASKPKKTRRRKHKRRNSYGSTGSSSKELAMNAGSSRPTTTPSSSSSRRESRRQNRTQLQQQQQQQRRRARSAMGRLSGRAMRDEDEGDDEILTEDILQIPQKYVHPKPLRVMDRYNIPSSIELAIYVVYNLALAYQLQARSAGESSPLPGTMGFEVGVSFPRGGGDGISSLPEPKMIIWDRIIKLYRLATDLLDQQQQQLEDSHNEDATMDPDSPLWSPTYTLALPNNLACAYHSNGDDVGASANWQQVLSHLWCILDVGCTAQVECFSQVFENAAHVMDGDDSSHPTIGNTATAA